MNRTEKNKLCASLLSRASVVLRTLDNANALLAPLLRVPFSPRKGLTIAVEELPKPRSVNSITKLTDLFIMKESKEHFPKVRKTVTNNELACIVIDVTGSKNCFSSHKRKKIAFFYAIKRLSQISNFFIDSVPLLSKIKNVTIIMSMINEKINAFLLKRFKGSIISINCNFVNDHKRVRKVENTKLTKVKFITALTKKICINAFIFRCKKLYLF